MKKNIQWVSDFNQRIIPGARLAFPGRVSFSQISGLPRPGLRWKSLKLRLKFLHCAFRLLPWNMKTGKESLYKALSPEGNPVFSTDKPYGFYFRELIRGIDKF